MPAVWVHVRRRQALQAGEVPRVPRHAAAGSADRHRVTTNNAEIAEPAEPGLSAVSAGSALIVVLFVPMNRGRRERRQTDRDVFRPGGAGCAVADPLAGSGHHRLTGIDLQRPTLVLHPHGAAEYDRDLLEFWALPRLLPAGWRRHPCDADLCVARVHAAGELFDLLRFGAGG